MRAARGEPDATDVRRDLSCEYAQLAVFGDVRRSELWVESAGFELHLGLSPAQVALLAASAVAAALAPITNASTEQCWQPRVADRSPALLDDAYAAILSAVAAYHDMATAREKATVSD